MVRCGLDRVLLRRRRTSKAAWGGVAGGTVEAVRGRESGFLVDATNNEVLRDAPLGLLGDKQLAEEMGEKGRQWACRHNWDVARKAARNLFDRF